MTHYLLRYYGGVHPNNPEESEQVMQAWGAWFVSMGEAVIDGGNPVGKSSTINPDGSVVNDGGPNPTGGYSVIQAESLDAALELAKKCPILQYKGSIEIANIIEM